MKPKAMREAKKRALDRLIQVTEDHGRKSELIYLMKQG